MGKDGREETAVRSAHERPKVMGENHTPQEMSQFWNPRFRFNMDGREYGYRASSIVFFIYLTSLVESLSTAVKILHNKVL